VSKSCKEKANSSSSESGREVPRKPSLGENFYADKETLCPESEDPDEGAEGFNILTKIAYGPSAHSQGKVPHLLP